MKTLILFALLSFPDDSQKKHMAISAFVSASVMIPCSSLSGDKFLCAISALIAINTAGVVKELGILSQDVKVSEADLAANLLGSLGIVVPLYFAF